MRRKSLLIFGFLIWLNAPAFAAGGYRELDWLELLTDADRKAMLDLPAIDHSVSPERAPDPNKNRTSQFTQDIKQKKARAQWQKVLTATTVRKELDGAKIRLAGFIVPLQTNGKGDLSEFFLVPYLGACIHVPPPPPNQLVYVRFAKGLKFEPDDIYQAYRVEGTLHTQTVHNSLADAAYTLTGEAVRIYQ